jgi:hypothetical protein
VETLIGMISTRLWVDQPGCAHQSVLDSFVKGTSPSTGRDVTCFALRS